MESTARANKSQPETTRLFNLAKSQCHVAPSVMNEWIVCSCRSINKSTNNFQQRRADQRPSYADIIWLIFTRRLFAVSSFRCGDVNSWYL